MIMRRWRLRLEASSLSWVVPEPRIQSFIELYNCTGTPKPWWPCECSPKRRIFDN